MHFFDNSVTLTKVEYLKVSSSKNINLVYSNNEMKIKKRALVLSYGNTLLLTDAVIRYCKHPYICVFKKTEHFEKWFSSEKKEMYEEKCYLIFCK